MDLTQNKKILKVTSPFKILLLYLGVSLHGHQVLYLFRHLPYCFDCTYTLIHLLVHGQNLATIKAWLPRSERITTLTGSYKLKKHSVTSFTYSYWTLGHIPPFLRHENAKGTKCFQFYHNNKRKVPRTRQKHLDLRKYIQSLSVGCRLSWATSIDYIREKMLLAKGTENCTHTAESLTAH